MAWHSTLQTSSLTLSAALLHAVLTNHVAHSEAMRQARHAYADLESKLSDAEMAQTKLEAEIRRQVSFSITQPCVKATAPVATEPIRAIGPFRSRLRPAFFIKLSALAASFRGFRLLFLTPFVLHLSMSGH